ncbi:vacuolar-type H+-ATPase subunit F/Vma7 [Microbacterium sp. AK009]|uniref:V-type ATP synthase subunit F n=1 Tax=Microbacterium sp. AK009 TaxID=2723068 RepID=UPI0015CC6691|nr:V-type ATP synthase subunit F [Microbacterium sp. AK009]NYF16577.1 vacuolar-type H+-ATPase subunit F/Vma7 [Microbacterium sp. AK009]
MSRLIVLTTPDIAPGYELAGAMVFPVSDAAEAWERLVALVDEEQERGVIAVHEPFHAGLSPSQRRRFDESTEPLVVPLPSGEPGGGDEGRRDRLMQLLWQAVGYEITFDAEGTTS